MEKAICETGDFLSFEPHEWKQVSTNPLIFEALKDNTVLKVIEIEHDDSISTQNRKRIEFKKGAKVEVSVVAGKLGALLFRLTYDDDFKTTLISEGFEARMIDTDS
jgi:hypothetical protein